jgi:hypothetical protein
MGLYERLTGVGMVNGETKIHVHQFMGALGELERGKMTRAQVISAYNLSASEQTELDTLTARILAQPESYPLGAYNVLTNVGTAFDTIAQAKGLGFVAVDVTGITRLEIRIRYNKVGTGTLTWQLWNETDGSEVGSVDDAAAAGDNKTASIVVTPVSPLSGGVKLLRPRIKSTVAADDPVYYGACLFLRRIELITSDVLHQLLLLAEDSVAPLNSVAALKTRLGV